MAYNCKEQGEKLDKRRFQLQTERNLAHFTASFKRHLNVVFIVILFYLFEINDRNTRGPLILSDVHKKYTNTHSVDRKVQNRKK